MTPTPEMIEAGVRAWEDRATQASPQAPAGLGHPVSVPLRVEVQRFEDDDHYYIYHLHPTHLTRAPRFRHISFEFAELEARRLLAKYPDEDSKYMILHAVAIVKAAQEESE
jgi:hypothetical protein